MPPLALEKFFISQNIKWPLIFLYLEEEEEEAVAAIVLVMDCNDISRASSRHLCEVTHLPPEDCFHGPGVWLLFIQN